MTKRILRCCSYRIDVYSVNIERIKGLGWGGMGYWYEVGLDGVDIMEVESS